MARRNVDRRARGWIAEERTIIVDEDQWPVLGTGAVGGHEAIVQVACRVASDRAEHDQCHTLENHSSTVFWTLRCHSQFSDHCVQLGGVGDIVQRDQRRRFELGIASQTRTRSVRRNAMAITSVTGRECVLVPDQCQREWRPSNDGSFDTDRGCRVGIIDSGRGGISTMLQD